MAHTMEYAAAQVRIGGSLLHTVEKERLSVPEVVVLRAVHGNDAVVNMKFAPYRAFKNADGDEVEYSDIEEFERLCNIYGDKLVAEVFPGHSPVMPKAFKDIGVILEKQGVATGAPAAEKKKKVTASAPKPGDRVPEPEQIGEDPGDREDAGEWFGAEAAAAN